MKKIKLQKIIVLVCLASIFGCGDSVGTIDEYVKSGNQFFAEENYEQARLQYKNALQIDDTVIDAYYQLALIDEKEKNWQRMFVGLSHVISLDPNHVDARLRLGQLQLLAGQLDQTTLQIDEVFKRVKDNPKAFALKGALLLNQKDFEGALVMADKALAIDSGLIDAINLKATVFQSQSDFKAALNVVNQALLNQPNKRDLYLLKLQIDVVKADNVAIEIDFLDLIQRFPEDIEYYFSLSKHYFEIGEQDKSYKLIQSVIDKYPANLKAKLLFSNYLINTDVVKAEKTIKHFIAENETEAKLYFRLAYLYIQQNKLEQAKQPLKQVIAIQADNDAGMVAKVLLAKLALQTNDVNTSTVLVNEVLAIDAGYMNALLLKARIELVNGLYDEAITSLRNILQDYSASDEAMVLLAQAYLKKGAPELAEENFRKALDLNPGNFSAVLPVVSRMIRSKDIMRAESFLLKALKLKPDHSAALQALAQVRLLRKDWLGSQQVADLIETKLKGNGFAKYLGGKISEGQGAYQQAIEKYKLALARNPQMTDALKSMLVCYNALKQKPLMLAYLDEFIKKNPGNSYPLMLKGKVYSLDKKWNEALAILNSGLGKFPQDPRFYEAIAHIYQNKNETPKVIEVYKKGLTKIPENIRLRMLLATVYEMEQDFNNARDQYEILLDRQPNLDIAVNNLVSLLLDHFPSKENKARAVELAQQFNNSTQPYFLDTYGWALLQDEKPKQALSVFEKLTVLKSDVAVFKYHLGLTYSELNMNSKAIPALEDALMLGNKESYFVEKELAQKLLKNITVNEAESESK